MRANQKDKQSFILFVGR
jgi:hypothetical protein